MLSGAMPDVLVVVPLLFSFDEHGFYSNALCSSYFNTGKAKAKFCRNNYVYETFIPS